MLLVNFVAYILVATAGYTEASWPTQTSKLSKRPLKGESNSESMEYINGINLPVSPRNRLEDEDQTEALEYEGSSEDSYSGDSYSKDSYGEDSYDSTEGSFTEMEGAVQTRGTGNDMNIANIPGSKIIQRFRDTSTEAKAVTMLLVGAVYYMCYCVGIVDGGAITFLLSLVFSICSRITSIIFGFVLDAHRSILKPDYRPFDGAANLIFQTVAIHTVLLYVLFFTYYRCYIVRRLAH